MTFRTGLRSIEIAEIAEIALDSRPEDGDCVGCVDGIMTPLAFRPEDEDSVGGLTRCRLMAASCRIHVFDLPSIDRARPARRFAQKISPSDQF